jgi:hypothetical protein
MRPTWDQLITLTLMKVEGNTWQDLVVDQMEMKEWQVLKSALIFLCCDAKKGG